jgi:hypothetical protein
MELKKAPANMRRMSPAPGAASVHDTTASMNTKWSGAALAASTADSNSSSVVTRAAVNFPPGTWRHMASATSAYAQGAR